MIDPISGISRGYRFVRFADEQDQKRALTEMQGVYRGEPSPWSFGRVALWWNRQVRNTNSTKERRRWIKETCVDSGIEILSIETKCDDKELGINDVLEVKTTSPDYKGQNPGTAAMNPRDRIRKYE